MNIIDVNAANIDASGFFCYMSKKKAAGYKRKLAWLKDRFSEGMRIKLLELPDRGFIEYLPGEHAWRTVDARGYMFIHCLWVVGKSKGKGYARALLDACIRDARRSGLKGVAMLTSEKVWLINKRLLAAHGFECVAEAAPSFSLMVKRFGKGALPTFIDNTETIRQHFKQGLTVFRTDQCPYIEDAATAAVKTAQKAGVKGRVVELRSAQEVRAFSPSPYGTFGLVLDGELLCYHYLQEKDLLPLLLRKRGA